MNCWYNFLDNKLFFLLNLTSLQKREDITLLSNKNLYKTLERYSIIISCILVMILNNFHEEFMSGENY